MTSALDRLDDAAALAAADPGDMGGHIRDLPEEMAAAWAQARRLVLPAAYVSPARIVVCAMGGSAIAADLLRGLIAGESSVPLHIVRGYSTPAFVDSRTIAVASSYSGGTEETLASFAAALERGAMPFVLTSGGALGEMAIERGYPHHRIAYDAPPRAAIAHSFMPMLALLERAGAIGAPDRDIEEALGVLAALRDELDVGVPASANPAKRLARALYGRVPVVYGAEHLAAVAQRWRTQIAENAEGWAFADELPELNHNTIAGYAHPAGATEIVAVVMLRAASLHERVLLRFDATRELLADAGVAAHVVEARGSSRLAQLLMTMLFGDYVSFYLALLNAADPSDIRALDAMKQRLADA